MANNTINFSYNCNNKLDNKAFTTIRLHNPNKYIVEKEYNILLNEIPKGVAVLQDKRTFGIIKLTDFICYLDTGYNQIQTINMLKRMYKNINLNTALFDLCLLVYKKVDKPAKVDIQTSLEL